MRDALHFTHSRGDVILLRNGSVIAVDAVTMLFFLFADNFDDPFFRMGSWER